MSIKTFTLFSLYGISTLILSAQHQEVLISHYLFPSFIQGRIKLMDGNIKTTNLNYNSITEEMIFDSNGTNLAIANPDQVDTIEIQGRLFVPVGKVFYEVLLNLPVPLFAHHLCTVTPPGNPSGYGGTSQTSAIEMTSSLYSTRAVYEMKLPSDYRIDPYYDLLLKRDNAYYKINNVNQLIKCFPEKKDAIKEYVKSHKTNFKKTEDVKSIVIFCNK
jgi:hypothetical protein